MYTGIFVFLVVVSSAVHAGPLNLFVNVTMDDRPDLDIVEGDIAYDHSSRRIEMDGWSASLRDRWSIVVHCCPDPVDHRFHA
jgi:hypothetical protein